MMGQMWGDKRAGCMDFFGQADCNVTILVMGLTRRNVLIAPLILFKLLVVAVMWSVWMASRAQRIHLLARATAAEAL